MSFFSSPHTFTPSTLHIHQSNIYIHQHLITRTITNQKHISNILCCSSTIHIQYNSHSYFLQSPPKMETLIAKICFTLLFMSSIFSLASSRREPDSSSNLEWWCNLTPHPEPCKYYITTAQTESHHFTLIKHRAIFRGMLVEHALNQALIMHKEALDSDQTNMTTENHRTVHGDCLQLYGKTIFHLNRSLECFHGKQNCSSVDAQTWLSTALTNMQTCEDGTTELGVEDFKAPNNKNNVTEMIRNSLAINMDFMKHDHHTEKAHEEAFPSWFSKPERKLLQSTTIKAHAVVAKDGSGDFRTVQDALDSAAKRKVKTRFVIHVKKGVYKENIEVAVHNDNIMLVGDGIRNTVITGSRSVQQGYTTYSSATAGE